jgi:hypothetical protein
MCELIKKSTKQTKTGPYGNQRDKGYKGKMGAFEHVWRQIKPEDFVSLQNQDVGRMHTTCTSQNLCAFV